MVHAEAYTEAYADESVEIDKRKWNSEDFIRYIGLSTDSFSLNELYQALDVNKSIVGRDRSIVERKIEQRISNLKNVKFL